VSITGSCSRAQWAWVYNGVLLQSPDDGVFMMLFMLGYNSRVKMSACVHDAAHDRVLLQSPDVGVSIMECYFRRQMRAGFFFHVCYSCWGAASESSKPACAHDRVQLILGCYSRVQIGACS
jgi:hypothetical protein